MEMAMWIYSPCAPPRMEPLEIRDNKLATHSCEDSEILAQQSVKENQQSRLSSVLYMNFMAHTLPHKIMYTHCINTQEMKENKIEHAFFF